MTEYAFPCSIPTEDQDYNTIFGLTKRELFAALALAGLMVDSESFNTADLAREAVTAADLLIKELRAPTAQ